MIGRLSCKDPDFEQKLVAIAIQYCKEGSTIRTIAKKNNTTKSYLHYLFKNILNQVNPDVFNDVMNVINYNKSVRNIRGGNATKEKFSKAKV